MATKLKGWGSKALVAVPLKKDRYFFASSLIQYCATQSECVSPALVPQTNKLRENTNNAMRELHILTVWQSINSFYKLNYLSKKLLMIVQCTFRNIYFFLLQNIRKKVNNQIQNGRKKYERDSLN